MNIDEPNITATGTVTNAFTLRISGAPTEGGTSNYALWVDDGATQLDGDLTVGGDLTLSAGADGALRFSVASSIKILDNTAASLVIEEADNAYMTLVTTNGSEAVKFDKALDINAAVQADSTITVGANTDGHDVKFFGNLTGAYMEWDESEDQLRLMGSSADATTSTGKLLLATALTDINANDVLGKIDFQAPHEAGGTDAITIAASIQAVAQGTFAADLNATDLIFSTGHSEAATEKFRITSQGELGVGGANYGTDGQVLTSTGAGTAPAWEALPSSGPTLSGSTDDTIATVTGSNALQGEANLKFSSGQVMTVSSSSASLPQILVENTANDATSGVLKFNVNKGAAGSDADDLGRIEFWGYDDQGTPATQQYATILGEIADASSGSETGKLSFFVAENDGTATTAGLALTGSTATDGEIDVTVGAGVNSVTTVAGVMTKPAQPAFSAYNAGHLSNVTGDGTVYGAENADGSGDLVGFALTSTRFNIGSGYSTSSPYVFTAPVDGRYLLSGCVQTAGVLAAHNEFIIYLKTSNYQFYVKIKGEVISGENYGYGQSTDVFSFIADMEAGDIAGLKIDVRGSTKVVDVNAHTFFSGCLLT